MDETAIEQVAKQAEDDWTARNKQGHIDEKLLRVDQEPLKEGYESYRGNDARVLFDISLALLSHELPIITLPIESQNDTEKDRMNKAERLCYGMLRELDMASTKQGHGTFLRELSYWALRWGIVAFPRIEEDDEGQPIFICDLYDPFQCYPEWDNTGIKSLARVYQTTRAAVEELRKEGEGWEDLTDQSEKEVRAVKIIDFWWLEKRKVWHAVLAGGKFLRRPKTFPQFKDIPIMVFPANGWPRRAIEGDNQWRAYIGQSILAANRQLYPVMDHYRSLEMQVAYNTANPHLVTKTPGGEPPTDELPKPGESIHLKLQETVEYMQQGASALQALARTIGDLQSQVQKGGLSDVVYGLTRYPMSGVAIADLKSLEHRLGPYQNVISAFLREMFMGYLRNLEQKEFKSIGLIARGHGERGGYMSEDFKKEDIPVVKYIQIELPLALKVDEMQNIAAAVSLWGKLSSETLMTRLLHIEDTALEKKRLANDMADGVMASLALYMVLSDRLEEAKKKGNQMEISVLERTMQRVEAGMSEMGETPEAPMGTPGMTNFLTARQSMPRPGGEGTLNV